MPDVRRAKQSAVCDDANACIIRKRRSSYKERKGNALASGAEEGRDKLRKAAGSGTYAIDPQISEWGNPAGENPVNAW